MFTNNLGLTQAAELKIATGDARPIRTNPEPVPTVWREKVNQEVQAILAAKVKVLQPMDFSHCTSRKKRIAQLESASTSGKSTK